MRCELFLQSGSPIGVPGIGGQIAELIGVGLIVVELAAGVPVAPTMQGVSFLPVLQNPAATVRKPLLIW